VYWQLLATARELKGRLKLSLVVAHGARILCQPRSGGPIDATKNRIAIDSPIPSTSGTYFKEHGIFAHPTVILVEKSLAASPGTCIGGTCANLTAAPAEWWTASTLQYTSS
jgi:hypothetical protein